MSLSCTYISFPEIEGPLPNAVDSDRDGLSDKQEQIIGTDPRNPDTDHDGLSDSIEVKMQLNPLNPDTDGDGVKDGDDIWPNIDNNQLYLFSVIGLSMILIIFFSFFHFKFGLTEKRKKQVKEIQRRRDEERIEIKIASNKIIELAKTRYGSLTYNDLKNELQVEPAIIQKTLRYLKAKEQGGYITIPAVKETYDK